MYRARNAANEPLILPFIACNWMCSRSCSALRPPHAPRSRFFPFDQASTATESSAVPYFHNFAVPYLFSHITHSANPTMPKAAGRRKRIRTARVEVDPSSLPGSTKEGSTGSATPASKGDRNKQQTQSKKKNQQAGTGEARDKALGPVLQKVCPITLIKFLASLTLSSHCQSDTMYPYTDSSHQILPPPLRLPIYYGP